MKKGLLWSGGKREKVGKEGEKRRNWSSRRGWKKGFYVSLFLRLLILESPFVFVGLAEAAEGGG